MTRYLDVGADDEVSSRMVTLVDESDRTIGAADKLIAHRPPGLLHRSFAVLLLDRNEHVVLQQRSSRKFLFPSRWSNTCCGHPGPSSDTAAAATARLHEELGVTTDLRPAGRFTMQVADPGTGMVEHEIDHVFVGRYDGPFQPDPSEVADVRVIGVEQLREDLGVHPERYTPWLGQVLDQVLDQVPTHHGSTRRAPST